MLTATRFFWWWIEECPQKEAAQNGDACHGQSLSGARVG